MRTSSLRLALLVAAVAWSASRADAQERWTVEVEPYVWIPDLTGEGSADGGPEADFQIDYPGGLSAALPLAIAVEGPSPSSWRFDLLYARWTDDEGSIETETELSIVEAGYGYALDDSVDVTAGLRGVELALEAEVASSDAEASEAWIDPWIGARGSLPLRGGWSVDAYGDVGGFGVGSDFTWQAAAYLAWSSERWTVELGYRALAVEFDDGDLDTELLAHGPILGLALRL